MHGQDYNTTTTFTVNPNEFTSTGNYTAVSIFDATGTMDTILVPAIDSVGTWSIDGDLLTQIIAGDTSTLTILELSDSKLMVREDFKEEVTFTSGNFIGFTINEATVYSSFDRQ